MEALEVAAAAVRDWAAVRSRLAPIIGEDGFRVLFARALHRARREHSWLSREQAAGDSPFALLQASLESRPARQSEEGSRALTAHFNELLNALIGEELAARLIGPL